MSHKQKSVSDGAPNRNWSEKLESAAKAFAIAVTPIAVAAIGPLFAWQQGVAAKGIESERASVDAARSIREAAENREERARVLAIDVLRSPPTNESNNAILREWAAQTLGFQDEVAQALREEQLPESNRLRQETRTYGTLFLDARPLNDQKDPKYNQELVFSITKDLSDRANAEKLILITLLETPIPLLDRSAAVEYLVSLMEFATNTRETTRLSRAISRVSTTRGR